MNLLAWLANQPVTLLSKYLIDQLALRPTHLCRALDSLVDFKLELTSIG